MTASNPHSAHDRAVLLAMVEDAGADLPRLLELAGKLPRRYRDAYNLARRNHRTAQEALREALQPPPPAEEAP